MWKQNKNTLVNSDIFLCLHFSVVIRWTKGNKQNVMQCGRRSTPYWSAGEQDPDRSYNVRRGKQNVAVQRRRHFKLWTNCQCDVCPGGNGPSMLANLLREPLDVSQPYKQCESIKKCWKGGSMHNRLNANFSRFVQTPQSCWLVFAPSTVKWTTLEYAELPNKMWGTEPVRSGCIGTSLEPPSSWMEWLHQGHRTSDQWEGRGLVAFTNDGVRILK